VSTTTKPSYAQPALIGGVVMGVLSALPLVAAGNLCCCLWIVSGGAIAAYLLQQNQSTPLTPGDGALVGLLAGLVGALVQFLVSIPIGILVAPLERAMLERVIEMAGTMPPEMRDALGRYTGASGEFSIGLMILRKIAELIFWLFVSAIFSTLGGLLGAMVFRRQAPPHNPNVIDIPPAS
jgi:hypothetical protein